jgi:integrase
MTQRRRGHGEGSVYKREDGAWCASIDLGMVNGKRKRKMVYGKTRKEVAEKLKTLQRDQAAGVTFTSLTVKDYLERWLEQTVKRKNRVRTYDRYAGDVRNYLIPELGKYQLAKLMPEHIQTLLNKLADAGLSHRSIRNVRAALRRALNQAMRFGYVVRNVAALVDVPGEVTFTPEPLDEEQVKRLLDAMSGHRWELLYRIALGLGLRKGEILGLRWEDVDFDAATLRISGSLQRQRGRLERTATKTEASIRVIALPPSLLAMLREHKQRQADMRAVARRWADTGLVFTSSVGTPIEPSDLSRHFKQVLKEAGLPEHTRFHDLRHSCATFLIVMGVHPRVVMEILGHSQISTTMNIYAHVLPRVQREAITGLDALFAETKLRDGEEVGQVEE